MTSSPKPHRTEKSDRDQITASGQRNTVDDQDTPRAGHGVVRGHVVVAIKLLRERIAEPWTLDLLADEVRLSRSQLARSFAARRVRIFGRAGHAA